MQRSGVVDALISCTKMHLKSIKTIALSFGWGVG